MGGSGGVEDILKLLDLTLCPLAVGCADDSAQVSNEQGERDSNDDFLVDDKELGPDCSSGQSGSEDDRTSL